jgi:hypothetical protein
MVRALVAGRGRADGLRAWASLCAVAIEGGGYGGGGGGGGRGEFLFHPPYFFLSLSLRSGSAGEKADE